MVKKYPCFLIFLGCFLTKISVGLSVDISVESDYNPYEPGEYDSDIHSQLEYTVADPIQAKSALKRNARSLLTDSGPIYSNSGDVVGHYAISEDSDSSVIHAKNEDDVRGPVHPLHPRQAKSALKRNARSLLTDSGPIYSNSGDVVGHYAISEDSDSSVIHAKNGDDVRGPVDRPPFRTKKVAVQPPGDLKRKVISALQHGNDRAKTDTRKRQTRTITQGIKTFFSQIVQIIKEVLLGFQDISEFIQQTLENAKLTSIFSFRREKRSTSDLLNSFRENLREKRSVLNNLYNNIKQRAGKLEETFKQAAVEGYELTKKIAAESVQNMETVSDFITKTLLGVDLQKARGKRSEDIMLEEPNLILTLRKKRQVLAEIFNDIKQRVSKLPEKIKSAASEGYEITKKIAVGSAKSVEDVSDFLIKRIMGIDIKDNGKKLSLQRKKRDTIFDFLEKMSEKIADVNQKIKETAANGYDITKDVAKSVVKTAVGLSDLLAQNVLGLDVNGRRKKRSYDQEIKSQEKRSAYQLNTISVVIKQLIEAIIHGLTSVQKTLLDKIGDAKKYLTSIEETLLKGLESTSVVVKKISLMGK